MKSQLQRPLQFAVSTEDDRHVHDDLDDASWVVNVEDVNDQVWRAGHISGGWVKNIIAVISCDKVKGDYYSHMMDRGNMLVVQRSTLQRRRKKMFFCQKKISLLVLSFQS